MPIDWKGVYAAATTEFTFQKKSAAVPAASIVGGPSQVFRARDGTRVQVSLALSSVCPGARS